MRIALYARVSTVNGGQNPEVQLKELREFCASRKWTITNEYMDRASGAKDSRPSLDRMMADARHRKFDGVLVWKFDRFARSVAHLLRALEEFKALGIEFVSLTEGVDTSTPMGKMVFTVLGAVAELERSLIVERIHAGLKLARSRGKRIGRPRTVEIDLNVARRRIKAGESLRAVARALDVNPALLHRRLKAD